MFAGFAMKLVGNKVRVKLSHSCNQLVGCNYYRHPRASFSKNDPMTGRPGFYHLFWDLSYG